MFKHSAVVVQLNENVQIAETSVIAGTHIEQNGKGGWQIVIHVLERLDSLPLQNGQRQLAQ